MDQQILFSEKQKFTQKWLWFFFAGLNGLSFFAVYKQILCGHPFGNKPMSNTGLLIFTIFTITFAALFFIFRLDTIIKKDGIYVRFFPFHPDFKCFKWETIQKSYVRQYSALSEYGGWGLRFGFFGKGKAYNVSGNKGLQLEFVNKEKLLIGTKKPEELSAALKKIGQFKG